MKPVKLDRLTESMVRRAETKGIAAGWYGLCLEGYTPAEIAIYCKAKYATDVRTVVRDWADNKGLAIPASCARIRQPSPPRPVEDWREAFRASVMRTGMCLALTQPMLEYLCATAEGVVWDRMGFSTLAQPNNSFTTQASLVKRGLIRRLNIDMKKICSRPPGDAYDELTDAGKCIVELLKVTGVFKQADRAIGRKLG